MRSAVHLLLSALSALAVTCARSSKPDVPAVPTPSGPAPSMASAAPASAPASAAPTEAPARHGPLSSFHDALARLAAGKANQHVRVAWLGDSHTAADFYPGALRDSLQKRYGDGGPGFVYLGFRVYRHGGIHYEREGRWSVEPRSPASRARTDDGVFGLGGVRAIPRTDDSSVTLSLRRTEGDAPVSWEIAYRLDDERSRFVVAWGAQRREVTVTTEQPAGTIQRLTIEAPADTEVKIGRGAGDPRVFGVVVERGASGVVVDTLGINGARVDTPLSWDEEAWVAELRRRTPALVVLAFGSNEVGDRVAAWRYAKSYAVLLDRVRTAAPEAACAILGLPDQAAADWSTPERVREIDAVQRQVATEQGCAFVSALDVMGGDGSFGQWAKQDPALATPDRIHLTPKGYAKLGEAITAELVPAP